MADPTKEIESTLMSELSNLVQMADGALNIAAVFVVLLLAFWRYVSANSKEKKLISVKASFVAIVEQLSASSETEKISAAILLRRFFDANTEMGLRGRPFKKEAVNLISGMLKVEPAGRLQKTLAEGLIYAVSVINQDLQKVNLHDVHLGKSLDYKLLTFRWTLKFWKHPRLNFFMQRFPDFTGSDFYKSDLSKASFSNCDLVGCVFYQADCRETVFKHAKAMQANFEEADLEGANFLGANLKGATFEGAFLTGADFKNTKAINTKFDGADLEGANFSGADLKGATFEGTVLTDTDFKNATNIPESIKVDLNSEGVFRRALDGCKTEFCVFLSRPGILNHDMTLRFDELKKYLSVYGLKIMELHRESYKPEEMLSDIATRIGKSDGVVIFGTADFYVEKGTFRKGTLDYQIIREQYFSAPWTQIEAGMAIANNKPILLINTCGLFDGIYDSKLEDSLKISVNMNEVGCSNELKLTIEKFKLKLKHKEKKKRLLTIRNLHQ